MDILVEGYTSDLSRFRIHTKHAVVIVAGLFFYRVTPEFLGGKISEKLSRLLRKSSMGILVFRRNREKRSPHSGGNIKKKGKNPPSGCPIKESLVPRFLDDFFRYSRDGLEVQGCCFGNPSPNLVNHCC